MKYLICAYIVPVSRVTGMHPGADHFGLYTLEIWLLHWWGETITIAMMGLFMNANLAQSVTALVQAASVISSSGFLKYARFPLSDSHTYFEGFFLTASVIMYGNFYAN